MKMSIADSKAGCPARLCILIFIAAMMWIAPAAAETTPQLACPSCEDYNPCTVDSCDEATGTCRHDPLDCDDHNACTTDTCERFPVGPSAGCRHVNKVSGTACDDGDACTMSDVCNGTGSCAGQLQAPGSACDDGNPCTAGDMCGAGGSCTGAPLLQGAECDDRNACTRGERCVVATDGSIGCQAPARNCDDGLPCTTDSCDSITGDCVHTAVSCDDGNPCTVDACDPLTGACGRTTREGACDDKNICTVNDFCQDGNCVSGGVGNCGWGGHCGSSICIPQEQRCLQDTSPTGCPPAGNCGNHYECRNGFCAFVQGSGPGACSDGNPCTLEMCVRGGCALQLILTGQACDDHSLCTQGDVCQSNTQCAGTPTCSDGNACTDDACDPATGACLGSQPKNCDDGNPCTTDSCDPAVGCRHAFNTAPCNDNNACTGADQCSNGVCQGAPVVSCPDDGNICTDDYCDRATGACIHPNNTNSCNDPLPCTVGDRCMDGTCQSGQPKVCNDSNICTEDSCDTATGACVFRPIAGTCSDNNPCTTGDACVNGTCTPGAPANCDDGNQCTTDGCSTFSGCFHTVVTGSCNDGNPCTTGDSCQNGVCRPTAPVSCIDGNACTIDDCDRATGACVHETVGGDCDDGDACTIDSCDPATGSCLGREQRNCDDGVDCTIDACDPASGCTHQVTCPQEVVDIGLSNDNPLGHGSGTLTWGTTFEFSVLGFNILAVSPQGDSTRLNLALIPCTECVTGAGASYVFIVPKHKSGKNIFVQLIGRDGGVLGTFGPAAKAP